MAWLDRLRSRRVLGSALGAAVGIALLVGGYWFVFGVGLGPGACACSPPAADFVFTENESASTVLILHNSGDALPASEVAVVVDGERRPWPEQGTTGARAASETSRVSVGDTYEVPDADPGTEIVVEWESSDGENRVTLARYVVGSESS